MSKARSYLIVEMISAAEGNADGPVFGLHELILDDFAEGGVVPPPINWLMANILRAGTKNEEGAGNDA